MTESITITADMGKIEDVQDLLRRSGDYINNGFILDSLTHNAKKKTLTAVIKKKAPKPPIGIHFDKT